MKKRLNTILVFTGFANSTLLLIAILASYLNPVSFPLPAFISLFFPVLWLFNLLFFVFALFHKRKLSLIPLVLLIASLYQLSLIFTISYNEEVDSAFNDIQIITYNTGNAVIVDLGLSQKRVFNDDFFKQADIICLQEFIPSHKNGIDILEAFPYKIDIDYYGNVYSDSSGLSILSKYKFIEYGWLKQQNEDTYALWSKLLIDNDTIILINVQLQSIRLEDDELDAMTTVAGIKQLPTKLSDIYSKIVRGYDWREKQVRVLSNFIKTSTHPIILCGDFNDPPSSYTYRLLSTALNDAFVKKGIGLGTTYNGNLPFLRIDYILVDNDIAISSTKKSGNTFSDHLPLKVNMNFSPK